MNQDNNPKWKNLWDNSDSEIVTDYDRVHDVTIAKRAEILSLFQENAYLPESNKTFLDLGAGRGAATFSILEKYKDAKAILIDGSRLQLENAQKSADKKGYDIKTVYQDLSDPDWINQCHLKPVYPMIVSSIMIHHLTDEVKARFFKDIYKLLIPEGRFIFADVIKMKTNELEDLHFDLWIEDMLKNKEKLNWEPITFEEQKKYILDAIEEQGDMPATIPYILKCFKEAGFRKSFLVWFYLKFAVFIGIK